MTRTFRLLLFPLSREKCSDGDCHGEANVIVHAAVHSSPPQYTAPGKNNPSHMEGGLIPDDRKTAVAVVGVRTPSVVDDNLLYRLHYTVASYLCEVEHGGAVLSCCPARVIEGNDLNFCTGAFMESSCGDREYVLYPVEEGKYALTVTIPQELWLFMGEAAATVLLSTAVRGYCIPAETASVSAVPTYLPLDARLKENSPAVQDAIEERMAVVDRVFQKMCRHPNKWSGMRRVIRRLCTARPSALRFGEPLSRQIHQMLREATCATSLASLQGILPSNGMKHNEKRFTCIASAVWYCGLPLHATAAEEAFEEHLLPAALSVVFDSIDTQSFRPTRDDGHKSHFALPASRASHVTSRCFAMFSRRQSRLQRGLCNTSGYVSIVGREEERRLSAPSSLCCAFHVRSGWTVAILLEAAGMPFVGVPLAHILSGVREMLLTNFESPQMAVTVLQHAFAYTLHSRATVSLMRTASGEALKAMTGLYIFRRSLYPVTVTKPRDTCLLSLKGHPRVSQESLPDSELQGSPHHSLARLVDLDIDDGPAEMATYSSQIEHLLSLSARLSRAGTSRRQGGDSARRCCRTNTIASHRQSAPLAQSVFSVLREGSSLVLFQSLPSPSLGRITDSFVFVIAVLDATLATPLKDPRTLRTFTTWLLSKTV